MIQLPRNDALLQEEATMLRRTAIPCILLLLLTWLSGHPFTIQAQDIPAWSVSRWGDSPEGEPTEPPEQAGIASRIGDDDFEPLGDEVFLTLMCEVSDRPLTREKTTAFFSGMYDELGAYWNAASYGKYRVTGTATGWYTLPRSSYEYSVGQMGWDVSGRLFGQDCMNAARAAGVNVDQYTGVQFVTNGFGGQAIFGGFYCEPARCWRATWLSPWGWNSLSNVTHEMGHTLGLGHSGGFTGFPYGNPYDVMSENDLCGLQDTEYGCLPQHTIAYNRLKLRWIEDEDVLLIRERDGVITATLDLVSQPTGEGALLLQTQPSDWFVEPYFYTLEVREFINYDRQLPGAGVVVHEVNPYRREDAWLKAPLIAPYAMGIGDTFYVSGRIEVCVRERTPTGSFVIQVGVGGNRCGNSSITFLSAVYK